MRKTNDTSKFDHAKLENRPLADSELDAVSGGGDVQYPILYSGETVNGRRVQKMHHE